MADGNGWSEYKREIEHRLHRLEEQVNALPDREQQCRGRIWQEIGEMKLRLVRMEARLVAVIGIATFAAAAVVQVLSRMIGR